MTIPLTTAEDFNNMTPTRKFQIEYPLFVKTLTEHMVTCPDPEELHMLLGLQTEVGELADAYKRQVGYNQELDEQNVKEELGDILFYLQGLCNLKGWNLEGIMCENVEKLTKRYPKGYTDKAAMEREDKNAV